MTTEVEKIFVPSSFGHDRTPADNCGGAARNCPNGYEVKGAVRVRKGYVNDTVRLSANDLKNQDCWHGGHYPGLVVKYDFGFRNILFEFF